MILILCFLALAGQGIACAQEVSSHKMTDYRYQAIGTLLNNYARATTFLELWPKNAELSLHIADKHDAVAVLLKDQSGHLLAQCQGASRIVLLNGKTSQKNLHYLGQCEHFDITFAADITSQFGSSWKQGFDEMLTLGDYLFIEAPVARSPYYKEIKSYLKKHGAKKIAMPPADLAQVVGNIYLVHTPKKYLIKRRWKYSSSWKLGNIRLKVPSIRKSSLKRKRSPLGLP